MPLNPLDTSWLQGGIPAGGGLIPTFGVPPCILNLGFKILSLLPGDALGALSTGINKGIREANIFIAEQQQKLLNMFGLDGDNQIDDGLGGLGGFLDSVLGGIGQAIGAVQAAQSFINSTIEEINAIIACLESFRSSQQAAISVSPERTSQEQLAVLAFQYQEQIEFAQDFVEKATEVLRVIGEVLIARANGELVDPDIDEEEEEEIFRLTFGAPESKSGSFLLSVDGLYYDSQGREYADGSEVPTLADLSALSFIPDTSKWRMDHTPNLGGKGTAVTLADVDKYMGTLFDMNLVDDSEFMKEFYDADHTISVILGNKSKLVTDMERDKQNLITSGYDEESAVISNIQQQIFSTIESFDRKLKKRKKQIEIAVKAYDLFGYTKTFEPGKIPVNDFSYLSNLSIDIGFEKQRKLVIDQGEVSGVVLPIKPVFVKQATKAKTYSLTPLLIAPIGTGAFQDTPPASSTVLPAITISDDVEQDGLVGIYSFLDANVEKPSSTKTNIPSCNDDRRQDGQLVGRSAQAVFSKGLGIPLLEGIVPYTNNGTLISASGLGSYFRLPSTKEYQDLMFNLKGCSFDYWLHMPGGFSALNLVEQGVESNPSGNADYSEDHKAAWFDYNYYKILLSNENIGGSYSTNPDIMSLNLNTDTVRGMLMGFTRDPQFTQIGTTVSRGYDTDIAVNYAGIDSENTVSSCAFFIAPTQSVKDSNGYPQVEFVRSGTCESSLEPFLGMTVLDTIQTKSGYTIKDASGSYVHMNVSFDVQNDSITVYLNNEELATSSMSEVFGIEPKKPARIPSFVKKETDASFSYNSTYVDLGVFSDGPDTDAFFTPWIFGGGWTDGLSVDAPSESGGFMGNSHGFYSGLGGRIGSLKIYNKPLNSKGVNKNFNAHKAFFQNIKIT